MQGVLIDPSTIVISYDYLRGEPRGHQKKMKIEQPMIKAIVSIAMPALMFALLVSIFEMAPNSNALTALLALMLATL